MNKFIQKATSGALALSTTITLTGIGMIGTAVAAPVTQANAELTVVRSLTASTHKIDFRVALTTDIKSIKLEYRIKPSGTATVPLSLATTSALLPGSDDTITVNSTASTGWTNTKSTPGELLISKAGGTGALTTGNPISISLSAITNNSSVASGSNVECDAVANSDTCYILISTYANDNGTSLIDAGVATYTVITGTTVTATVDPSLTFTVAGITTLTAINTNDSNAACTGADVAATSTSIPFGNITVGVSKCGQQSITVGTNAQLGYKVYHKFVGTAPASDMMVGTNASNNIDPYANGATWAIPTAFSAAPTGSANVDSGWFGARVVTPGNMSPGIGQFATSNFYAPPAVTANLGNLVMDKTTPDSGNSPTYVTYKILAGASQPADSYTGTMVYNVVATY